MGVRVFDLSGVSSCGAPAAGFLNDVLESMSEYDSTAEIDFVADDPGPTLFHCHHQDHMDEGFAGLITCTVESPA
jgi:FtsP/CotA-like multicopper oxidase with cupredoxin domain